VVYFVKCILMVKVHDKGFVTPAMKTEAEPPNMHSQAEPGNDLENRGGAWERSTSIWHIKKEPHRIHSCNSCDSWSKSVFMVKAI